MQRRLGVYVAMDKNLVIQTLLVNLLDDLPFDGVIVHDKGLVLDVNDQFCDLFGVQKEDIVGKNIFDIEILTPESAYTVRQKLKLNYEGLYQADGLRPSGESFPIEIYVKQAKAKDQTIRVAAVRDLSAIYQAQSDIKKSHKNLQSAFVETVRVLSSTLEKRDPYTAGHQAKVASLSVAIGKKLKMDDESVFGLEMGALVHDLGKIAVPAELLAKPSRLTDVEFTLIKTHSEQGFEILASLGLPWPIARMAHEHHERIDGSGYPQGLVNGGICDESKIIAVADMVEAISAHRPYRAALGMQVALGEVNKVKGKALEREIVDACTACILEDDFSFEQVLTH